MPKKWMRNTKSATTDSAAERARINAETAKLPWQELQRFFAQGRAVAVSSSLDLVDVAWEMSRDNSKAVSEWMDGGQVGPVADELAISWLESNTQVWCVVVKPWVLVQPVLPENGISD